MEDKILQKLKDILLEEEVKRRALLEREVLSLKEEISPEHINSHLEPIVDNKVNEIKNNMTALSGEALGEAIRTQIRNNRDDIIDALYPIMGSLISKYIQVELERLSENINKQIDDTFSWKAIKREFLALFGIKEKDQLMKDALAPVIEEGYVIYQNSGLLIGHYTRKDTVDQDMIAGMLTAIKSFVEDAFQQKGGNLDMIEYGTFKIIIQNSYRYYIVAVVSGVVDTNYKLNLLKYLNLFAERHLAKLKEENLSEGAVSELLGKHLLEFDPEYIF
ncbi:hypothetical protein [Thermoflexibacter ruber]|uniref:Cell envelope biogenesis protein OmpA n=1 Tax=Thermoflexibacter ruber TaxID=1003 RepID=A0A1I2EXI0_9BACT|nr:hypothetical protein [Thermoflexibacter ruber]SFE97138.1 hypothetical protein SAMN04488541_101179 [Thermoflexibacter ruber]